MELPKCKSTVACLCHASVASSQVTGCMLQIHARRRRRRQHASGSDSSGKQTVPDIIMRRCGTYLALHNPLVQGFMLLKDVAEIESVDGRLPDLVLVVHDETVHPDPETHPRNLTLPTAVGMPPPPPHPQSTYSLRCCAVGTVAGGVCACVRVCACLTELCTRASRAGHCCHCRPTGRRHLRVRRPSSHCPAHQRPWQTFVPYTRESPA